MNIQKERISSLPDGLATRVKELTSTMHGEYKKGWMAGALFVYEAMVNVEKWIEEKAVERAGKWFEEEIVAKKSGDEIYTDELVEKFGYQCLANVQDKWALEFFMRVEMERESLRNEYSKKTRSKGEDTREGK